MMSRMGSMGLMVSRRVASLGGDGLQPAKTVNGLFTHSNAKRLYFALAAFIKPVVAAYNLSSLMLGSSRLPFYSPVSFVFRQ